MMNILVTGSSGFVGSHLAVCFSENQVVGLDCLKDEKSKIRDQWGWDISDPIPGRMILENPLVIHAAASIDGNRETLWNTNVMGTKHVLDWAVKNRSPHIIFFSTGGIYGYHDNQYVDESSPVNPANLYAHSKFMGESLLMMYHRQYNIPVTILRLFFPYGPGVKRGMFSMIKESIQNETPLKINEGGAPRFNPIHIEDVVNIVLKLATGKTRGMNVFNICGDDIVSFLDLVMLYQKGLGRNAFIEKTGQYCGDLLGDGSLVKRVYSWKPIHRIFDIVQMVKGL